MREAKSRAQSKTNGRASGELRVVAINCNPAPDAQNRLRRLFTLLLELTSEESQSQSPAGANAVGDECEDGNGC